MSTSTAFLKIHTVPMTGELLLEQTLRLLTWSLRVTLCPLLTPELMYFPAACQHYLQPPLVVTVITMYSIEINHRPPTSSKLKKACCTVYFLDTRIPSNKCIFNTSLTARPNSCAVLDNYYTAQV